jgi:fibro-slime domain-containing protein/LPXTG-motif cell wall-anchored protein
MRKLLSGFLAVSTAIAMLGGSAATLLAEEPSTEYALAGAGTGEDITIHFGDDEDKSINVHVNPESNAETLAGLGSEAVGDETESETENTGLKEVKAGGFVTISSVDETLLPEEAEASAEILSGKAENTAVEKVEEVAATEPTSEASDPTGSIAQDSKEEKTAGPKNAPEEEAAPEADGKTEYQAFDISLDNVDEEQYQDGFKVEVSLPEDVRGRDFRLFHIHEGEEPVEIPVETVSTIDPETGLEVVSGFEFTTDGFSEFVLQYTVDFEYSVNGKMYQFSLPGGGFVSFADLIEVLGIIGDTNFGENGDENGSVIADNAEENAVNEGAEENGVNADTNAPLTLGDMEVSEATRKFVADVASVEFSSPELVDVSKVEGETTVGQIKESRGLECEYSAELTEEQIAEINEQTVDAGDWALISVQPFTSEETLSVTMQNGETFTIQVTDGQLHTFVISDRGDTYEVIVTYDDTAEIPEDAELVVREIQADSEEFAENLDLVNEAYTAQDDPEIEDPVQFDISIVSGNEEVEPKEGSTVKVEIRLAKSMFGEAVSAEEDPAAEDADPEEAAEADPQAETEPGAEPAGVPVSGEETGLFLYNGQEIALDTVVLTGCRIAHIAEDGTAEIIEDVESSMTDDKIVMQFETESFSDYLFDGNSGNGLNNLPSTIYVGDEIYMWNQANYWVTNIGSVVTETKANNSDNHKTVTAIDTGTFKIVYVSNTSNPGKWWNNNGKTITVLPARSGTTPPATIDTIDNASIGLTLNLFDYDTNGYLDSYFNGSSHNDNPLSAFAGSGINSGNALKFWGSGIGNNYGSLNQYVEHGVTSIVKTNLNSAGYPVLSDNSGGTGNRDLSYLFTPSDGTDKRAYTNVNGLFKKDGDYYVYDSNQNYAYYDVSQGSGGSFAVYNSTYNQKSGGENGSVQNKSIGFFPFHPWDDQYDLYVNWNKNLNHHFGMSMSVPFSLPKDPKAVVDTNGQPFIFEFSGDDDLWVFIDGKLAMDIGGIHQPTSGTINFQTGVVTVNGSTQIDNSTFNSRFSDLYDGKQHTLQVFYIERGGCDSNCKIKFNMTLYGDIHFDKVDEDNPTDELAGAVFGLYKDEACTIPVMERLKNAPDRAYIAESDANGRVQFSDIPIGTYYLKELHAPEGYPLDNTVHTVQVFYGQAAQQVKVKVTIDGVAVENGVKITNKKPTPITLGLKKEWQNEDGGTIAAPAGATATFEIKRIRTYETYTEQTIEGEGRQVSHLTVGWIHNGQMHVHGEYDLIAGTTATVSWGYNTGYTGSKDCIVNGTRIDKDYVTSNVISEALTMPAAGGSATFYVIDDSENGEAIRSINVAGSQFYGNSGGGVIHTFQTVTEPDPDFSYTGDHVTNNQVTLPINSNTWSYDFTNLPTFERGSVEGVDHPVSFNYTYYLEEVSNTAPEGTTVIYTDLAGNPINSPTDAETSTGGTQTITNKVPTGYFRIDKEVTFNGVEPTTATQKSALAGTYTFKVYTDADCSKPCKVIQGVAPNQQEVDLVLTVTIGDDGAAQSSETVRLPIGDYWIEEQTPTQTGVTPDENRIKVTITAEQTTEEPAIASFTNNKEESDNPDELAIELEKTFTGLSSASKIPANYQAALTYTYNGSTVTVPLTGTTQGNVTCTKSADGLTWHWRITQIPKTATNFGVYESNYDITGYTRITKINGSEVQNPGAPQTVSVLVPEITMTNPTSDYTTTDKNKVFTVEDNQILLVRMTNHATVIVSQKSLSYSTRQAIEKMLRDNGGKIPGDDGADAQWVMNFVYFSHEIQGDSFSYGGRTIFFEGDQVKIPHKSSSHEVRVDIGYTSTSAENSFTLENIYTEIPTEVDVLKVEKGNKTTTRLPNAVFELRKLEDVAPTNPGGTLTYVKDNDQVIVTSATTDDNGRLTFSNLTHGVYEIREVTPPPGYIQTEDVTFYLRVDGGVITYVQKGSNKPSEWTAATNSDGATVYFMEAQAANPDGDPPTAAANATFRVGNTPGVALPHTGGSGTTALYLLGIMLTGLAGAGLVMRKRRRVAV